MPLYSFENKDGVSAAAYKGTISRVRAFDLWQQQKQGAKVKLTKIEKLMKSESTLLWGALNEFDYEPGEVYSVMISTNYAFIMIYVEIQKDKSVNYYGWSAPSLASVLY